MQRFVLLMHDDAPDEDGAQWGPYLATLRASGRFDGGSSIGGGVSCSKGSGDGPVATPVVGYLLVSGTDLADVRGLLAGNPTYEAGGTVEIRELVED